MVKTVVVTGGESGIGLATAKLLAAENYQVMVLGLSNSTDLEAAGLPFIACDISDGAQVDAAMQ